MVLCYQRKEEVWEFIKKEKERNKKVKIEKMKAKKEILNNNINSGKK